MTEKEREIVLGWDNERQALMNKLHLCVLLNRRKLKTNQTGFHFVKMKLKILYERKKNNQRDSVKG